MGGDLMYTRYDLMPVVPFDGVQGFDGTVERTPGVVLKAACTSSDATEAGRGIGAVTDNITGIEFSSAGAKATSSVDGWYIPINSRYQKILRNAGTLQFDVLKSDLMAATDTTVKVLLALTGASRAVAGPNVYVQYDAPGSASSYRQYTDGSDGSSSGYTGAIALRYHTNYFATGADYFKNIITNLTADTDGYVTVSLSWDTDVITWLFNGVPVSTAKHKKLTIDVTDLRVLGWLGTSSTYTGVTIKNILLMTSPRPNVMRARENPRVVLLGHSFLDTAEAATSVLPMDSVKAWNARASGHASDQSIGPSIYRNLTKKCSMWNVATGATNLSVFLAKVNNTAYAYPAGDGSNSAKSMVMRWRPHIVVIIGANNEATSAVGTAVNSLNAALIGKGVVPIWVREQNRNATGSAGTSYAAYDAALLAQLATDEATYGDIGIVDCYTPTGGATVEDKYVENYSAHIHPSFYAYGQVYGPLIAAEIDRLLKTPPAYAWWK